MNFREVNKSVDDARVLFKINIIIYLPRCARLYKRLIYELILERYNPLINDYDDNNYNKTFYIRSISMTFIITKRIKVCLLNSHLVNMRTHKVVP